MKKVMMMIEEIRAVPWRMRTGGIIVMMMIGLMLQLNIMQTSSFQSLEDRVLDLLHSDDDDFVQQQYALWISHHIISTEAKLLESIRHSRLLQKGKKNGQGSQVEDVNVTMENVKNRGKMLHLHMYKTGGSTINKIFGALCLGSKSTCLEVNLFRNNSVEMNELIASKWDDNIKQTWLDNWIAAEWIWGHWWYPTTPKMRSYMPIDPERDQIVTMLRDPFLTEISSMFYQLSLGRQQYLEQWGVDSDSLEALTDNLPKIMRNFSSSIKDHYRVDFLVRIDPPTEAFGFSIEELAWFLSYASHSDNYLALQSHTIAAMERMLLFAYVGTTEHLDRFFDWILDTVDDRVTLYAKRRVFELRSVMHNNASPIHAKHLEDFKKELDRDTFEELRRYTLFDRHLFLFGAALEQLQTRGALHHPINVAGKQSWGTLDDFRALKKARSKS